MSEEIKATDDIERVRNTYDSLKRIHIAANDANDKLIILLDELRDENEFLKTQLINSAKNLEIQKVIVLNTIQSSQEKHERDYQEILDLKNEIKLLKSK